MSNSKKSYRSKKSSKAPEHTIEQQFQKMDPHEHALALPDTYIGGIEEDTHKMWVYDEKSQLIVCRDIKYIPGLYKIFDEIIVNSRDQTIRDRTCKTIKISINQDKNLISCFNDGQNGIPVAIHQEYNIYVPELIFGNLLSSGNFHQTGKTVGGKNGLGAKLANIYSTYFYVEIVDGKRKLKYTQKFSNNMYTKEEPVITQLKGRPRSSVFIEFSPDLSKFGCDRLSDDMISLFKKRIFDVAACTHENIKVYLNKKLIHVSNFEDYVHMFYDVPPSSPIFQTVNDRWEICAVYDSNSGFRHISYVNGICTFQGGSHINHVMTRIVTGLADFIRSKHKNLTIKNAYIRDNITIFINAVIEDPSFNSQTKEFLTNKVASYGSRCNISDDFIQALAKTGIVNEVLEFASIKESVAITKMGGKKTKSLKGLAKLDDANWAATRKSKQCFLILTEGDSAKNFAVAGTEIIGKDRYGVFPLRGKLLNVREAKKNSILNNAEIKNIIDIMGLKPGKIYTPSNLHELRYGGGIIILTDQDYDGSHIKGLVINFLHFFWPSLLKINGFVRSIATPIVKAWKKTDTRRKNIKTFYTLTDFEKWKNTVNSKLWHAKFYKGLGTSTATEAKESFNDFENRNIKYFWTTHDSYSSDHALDNPDNHTPTNSPDLSPSAPVVYDTNSNCHDAIVTLFAKNKANARKEKLLQYDKNVILENNETQVSFTDFIYKDLIHFSNLSVMRAVPSLLDGLKPSQRKILFGVIHEKIFKKEMRVAQIAGIVSAIAAYHHGEKSLQDAIVKLAQDYPGSNNINILKPAGDFGNRRQGGKNAASARYIHSHLSEITPLIFRSEDEHVYHYVVDDGIPVEPVNYAPIIPMILVNGTLGIGTGYSSTIPCFNPMDIIFNLRRLLTNKPLRDLSPWYYGFTGRINKIDKYTFQTCGLYEIVGPNTIIIQELPIGFWTEDYFTFLDKLVADDPKTPQGSEILQEWSHNCGLNTIHITIVFLSRVLNDLRKTGTLEKKLKLHTNLKLTNMHLFDENNTIHKYDSVNDITLSYFGNRLQIYAKRKEYFLALLKNDLDILTWKIKFIDYVISKKIIVFDNNGPRQIAQVIAKVKQLKFPKLSTNCYAKDIDKTFNYITNIKLFDITVEELEKLRANHLTKLAEYNDYKTTSIQDMWLRELHELSLGYKKWRAAVALENQDLHASKSPTPKSRGRSKNPISRKGRGTSPKAKGQTTPFAPKGRGKSISSKGRGKSISSKGRGKSISSKGRGKSIAPKGRGKSIAPKGRGKSIAPKNTGRGRRIPKGKRAAI